MSRMQRFDWQAGLRSSAVRRFLAISRRRSDLVSPPRRRLHFEPLEDRHMLATFMVMNNADSGTDSLRDAIASANAAPGADEITFDGSLSGQTITLTSGELAITEALTITGLGQGNLTISGNNASRIFNITAATGDFTLAGLMLTGGKTTGSGFSGGSGGAIKSLTLGNLTLDQSTVSGNSTAGNEAFGGGIFSSGNVTLTSSTVSGNSTAGDFGNGGGIFSHGSVTLTSSTVSGNSTAGGNANGGGIRSSVSVTLTSSTVSGNSTAGGNADGGGIFSSVSVTLTSSTVSGNSTAGGNADGGGIVTSTVTLMSSTVTDNHAYYANATGGGIWNFNDTITITNSILAGNTAGGGMDDIDPGTGSLNIDFSLIEQIGLPFVGIGNVIGFSANLGLLGKNGGPTQTHALLAGSLALDMGDPAASPGVGSVPLFDQRGNNFGRVQNGRIDMGAFEIRDTLSADFDSDGFITGVDFLLWQRGFGIPAPDATKADGDADNDLDVDSSDLDIWQLQYGTAAPLVAATSALIATEPVAQPTLTSSELADLALAVALAEEADWVSSKREFVAHSPPLEFFSAKPIGRNDGQPSSGISSSATTSTPRDDERLSSEGPSPWEDTVDKVFASAL